MSKRQTIMALGICVIILPFLGFPGFWGRLLIIIAAALIVGIAYAMRPQAKPASSSNMPYVEHKNSIPAAVPTEKPVPPQDPAPETTPTTPVHN